MRTVRSPLATTAAVCDAWRSGSTMERRSNQPNNSDRPSTTSTATALIHWAREAPLVMASAARSEASSDAPSKSSIAAR